jgi:hypothetical protein
VLVFGGVVVTPLLLSLPLLFASLFAVTAAAVLALGFRSQRWLGGPGRLTTVRWLSDGRWILSSSERKNIPATLSPGTRLGHGWLWLRWRTDREVRSLLLLNGDAPAAELRRLNARLRLEMGA